MKLADARSEIRAQIEIAQRALQIRTGAEGVARAREHDGAHARVGGGIREAGAERDEQLGIECVLRLRTIHDQRRDGSLTFHEQHFHGFRA